MHIAILYSLRLLPSMTCDCRKRNPIGGQWLMETHMIVFAVINCVLLHKIKLNSLCLQVYRCPVIVKNILTVIFPTYAFSHTANKGDVAKARYEWWLQRWLSVLPRLRSCAHCGAPFALRPQCERWPQGQRGYISPSMRPRLMEVLGL